jgi:Trp operon repressor
MVALESAFLGVGSNDELGALMRLLFTPTEIRKCRTRWKACQLSAAGLSQRKIRDRLKVGVATATRAAKTTRRNTCIVHMLVTRASELGHSQ